MENSSDNVYYLNMLISQAAGRRLPCRARIDNLEARVAALEALVVKLAGGRG